MAWFKPPAWSSSSRFTRRHILGGFEDANLDRLSRFVQVDAVSSGATGGFMGGLVVLFWPAKK